MRNLFFVFALCLEIIAGVTANAQSKNGFDRINGFEKPEEGEKSKYEFSGLFNDKTFYIRNANGKYLDADGNSSGYSQGSAFVQLWEKGSGDNQKWTFFSSKTNFVIKNKGNSGYLTFDHPQYGNYTVQNGLSVVTGKDNAYAGYWHLVEAKGNNSNKKLYKIVEISGKALDADGASDVNRTKNGTKVQLWDSQEYENQLWELIEVK